MPIFEDYLFFTNSFAASDQWSLDPYADEDDDEIMWNFGVNQRNEKEGDDD